ncbi:hypothetical protein AB0K51_09500 [Kitasatospora sp. NPDC049285]
MISLALLAVGLVELGLIVVAGIEQLAWESRTFQPVGIHRRTRRP